MKPINKPINSNVAIITQAISILDTAVDDKSNIKIYGNILIKDKISGTVLLNKRI
jgi:hypothetical protein